MITSLLALVIPFCPWLFRGYLQAHAGVGMYGY